MLKKTSDLEGCRLGARDGDIGVVEDFYFDDLNWTIRYMVANTGAWLPKRQVLISPHAVRKLQSPPGITVEVDLTKGQIEKSPSIETDKPVSRQFEEQYHRYYAWPAYWEGPWIWGPIPHPGDHGATTMPPTPPAASPPAKGDPHLRSVNEVLTYNVHALDRETGHIEDLLTDDVLWAIRYLVIDTRNWLPGRRVLVPPQWISWVSWSESRVYLDLDRDTIARAPEYDPFRPITREYEEQFFSHYGREPYWSAPSARLGGG